MSYFQEATKEAVKYEKALKLIKDKSPEEREQIYNDAKKTLRVYDRFISQNGSSQEMEEFETFAGNCLEFEKNPFLNNDYKLANYLQIIEGLKKYVELKGWNI